MRGEFVDLDGVRIYCFAFGSRGTGDPIVLVHGSFTSSYLWRRLLSRLPAGHRVLILDLAGHGRSDPSPEESLTVTAHADRLVRLLDVMAVDHVTFVGHDMGAAIVARVAQDQPQRVRNLVLVNPVMLAGSPQDPDGNRRLSRLARTAPLWRRLSPGWLASALHSALLPSFVHPDTATHALDVYLRPYRSREGRNAACKQLLDLEDSRTAASTGASSRAAFGCPTAVVFGQLDPFVRSGREAFLKAELHSTAGKRLEVHTLPGTAHASPEEIPDRLGSLIAGFLASNEDHPVTPRSSQPHRDGSDWA